MIQRGSAYGVADYILPFDSNATLTDGDLVNVQSGQLELPSAGQFIAGSVNVDATSSTANAQVNATPGLRVVMDSNASLAATDIGYRYNVAGATGAQLVDVASKDTSLTAPSHQLLLLENNPQGIDLTLNDDLSVGLYMIAKTQFAGLR